MQPYLRKLVIGVLFPALCSVASAQQDTGRTVHTFAHAGISLEVADVFESQLLEHPNELVRLVKFNNKKPEIAVILGAYLVGPEDTMETVSAGMQDMMKGSLSVRDLNVLKKTPISVAGITGQATLMEYKFRGTKTVSAQTYFIRELKNLDLRICYILSVEAAEQGNAKLLGLLGEVIGTIKLTAVEHPAAIKVSLSGNKIKNLDRGIAINVPVGWYGRESRTGIRLGINDYLLGGANLPSVDVVAVELQELTTSENCAKKVLAAFVAQAESEELDVEVVCEEPIEIADKTGSSFVIIVKPRPTTQPATQPEKTNQPTEGVVRAVATLAIPMPEKKITKSYGIIMTARQSDCKTAKSWLKKLGEGVVILNTSK